jgi:hypothetical protein
VKASLKKGAFVFNGVVSPDSFLYICFMSKEQFFKTQYIPLLRKLKGDEKGKWGVLSPQGMIEHMTDSVGVAWERIREPLQTPAEQVERMKSFAMSDKEFKPGTKNALMSETPAPLRNNSIEEAISELELEIKNFMDFYHSHPEKVVTNPFFGDLNYDEWLHLLHKHAVHHLKQFGILD